MRQRAWLLVLASGAALWGCRESREVTQKSAPTFAEVGPLLREACLDCHGGDRTEGGYAILDYWSTLGCTADGRVMTEPRSEQAPLLRVLEREDHRSLLSAGSLTMLRDWVYGGAQATRSVAHAPGILDPRGDGWHGTLAASDGFRALRDETAPLACGRCHEGAPVRLARAAGVTDGATACTGCHTEPEGALACSTCHGAQGRSYPPRDACYFGGSATDPHVAHVDPSKAHFTGFACGTCHPTPEGDLFAGDHANGRVDLVFSPSPLTRDGTFRAEDKSCSVGCHARMGELPEPAWTQRAPLDCQSCHLSPPAEHPPGQCSGCHGNMGPTPESLVLNALHLNGTVDVGDGKGTCGSCHGEDESGAPADLAHTQHLTTLITLPLDCASCHPVPAREDLHAPPSHMNGSVEVMLGARAEGRPGVPRFDATQKTCSQVACHGDRLVEARWGDISGVTDTCQTCHATPPPPPHSTLPGCGGGLCHGGQVAPTPAGFRITESGRAFHIDGRVQAGAQ